LRWFPEGDAVEDEGFDFCDPKTSGLEDADWSGSSIQEKEDWARLERVGIVAGGRWSNVA